MHRFKNILFSPLGKRDNPAALRRIAGIAGRNSGRLTLLGVAPEPPMLQRVLQSPDLVDKVIQAQRDELDKKLQRWAAHDATGAACAVEVGDPALTIIRHVITNQHDLVVVTTDEDREDHATIRRLLRKCPCPVWLIKPQATKAYRCILAAVDVYDGYAPREMETRLALNREILEKASAVAVADFVELNIVHAWQAVSECTMRRGAYMTAPEEEGPCPAFFRTARRAGFPRLRRQE